MNTNCFAVRSIILVLCLIAPDAHAVGGGTAADPPVPGEAIVRLKPSITIETFLTTLNQDYPNINASWVDSIPEARTYLIAFTPPAPLTLESKLETQYSSATGPLVWGELNYEGRAPEGGSGSTWVDDIASYAAYEDQYAVTTLGLTAASKQSTGATTVVAVLDTGIDPTHPLMAGRIAPGGYNFTNNSSNTADAGDGVDNNGNGITDEMSGHGTYVTGLIHLVAPDARFLPVVVLDTDGVGNGWWFLKGLRHAMSKGVEVINMSLMTTYESRGVYEALLEARQLGIVVVAAAGNANTDDPRQYPAMMDLEGEDKQFPNDEWLVFGVAALNHQDVKASFTNYHKNLFISAPGASVLISPGNPNMDQSIISALPGGGYYAWEGTSMSTPLVSGAVALIRSQHPEWSASITTWKNIRDALMNTVDDICPMNPGYCPPGDEPLLGLGRLNVADAVALGPPAPPLADLNGDGSVDVNDLLKVINDWGLVHTPADINGDGVVNVDDLLLVINYWG